MKSDLDSSPIVKLYFSVRITLHLPSASLARRAGAGAGDEKVALELPPLRRNCLNFFTEKFIGPANTAKFCPYSHHDYQEDRRRTRFNPTFGGILLQKLLALRTRKTMERVFLENKFKGLLTMSLWIVTRTRFTRLQCVVLSPTSNMPRLLSGEEEH